jgi:phage recombination protein Bet
MNQRSTALAQPETPPMFTIAERYFGADRLQVLKAQIAPDATDAELELFAMTCQRSKLDPFAKQIWFYRRRQGDPPIIQASIDGLRLIAERTGQYAGQEGPEFLGKDGQWRDAWIETGPPVAARVGVLRRGFEKPVREVAVWERAKQTYTVQGQVRLMPLWSRYGPEMLAKTAEARALRRAFPQETSGLEVRDIPNFDDEVSAQARLEHNASRYDEIFGDDGEVVQEFKPSRERDVDDAPADTDAREAERQRRQEGLL